MKQLVKICLLFLLPTFAFGQNLKMNIDSFKQALNTAPDSVAFKLNFKLAFYYYESNRDSALYFFEKCLTLAQRNNKTLDEAAILGLKGDELMLLGKLSESYESLSKALKMAENSQNEGKTFGSYSDYNPQWTPHQQRLFVLAVIHLNYGHLLGKMGKTDEQTFHYKEIINISETIGNNLVLGLANMNLGQIYLYELGKLDSALLMEQNVEKMFIQTNQKAYLTGVYLTIGRIFLKQKKNELAVQYFHKGIQSAKEHNNEAVLGENYSALAQFYLSTEKNRDSSLHYALKNLEVLKSMGSKDLAVAYSNLSDCYSLNNKPDSAFKYKNLAYSSLDSTSKSKIESLTKAQSLAFDDQLKLQETQKQAGRRASKLKIYGLLGCLGVFSIFSLFLYRNNRQKQKANTQLQTTLQDLQVAQTELENKNRETEIEVALERIRSRSNAMQKSGELGEVKQLVLEQLQILKIKVDGFSLFLDFGKTKDWNQWASVPGGIYNDILHTPYIDHPGFNIYLDAYHAGLDFVTSQLSFEEKNQLFDHIFRYSGAVPEERKKYVFSTEGMSSTTYFLKNSTLAMITYTLTPYTASENEVLRRIAYVFDQAYTRFLDLQKAEAQAIEANRRASLDRVRAETASMRTTVDLDKIIPLIWNELTILGISFIRCGVFIIDEMQEQIHIMLSTPTGKSIAAFYLPFNNTQGSFTEIVSHWRKHTMYKDHWDQATFADFTANLLKQGTIESSEQYATDHPPMQLDLQFLPFTQGMLYVGSETPLNNDELETVQSLADAFSSAYARYEDFTKLDLAKQEVDKTLIELKQTQAQLVQKEKLASLGELTAGIAHEIQNPLNFVNNFAEFSIGIAKDLNDELDKPTIDKGYIEELLKDLTSNQEKINFHGKRASSIVKGMLGHSRASTGKKEMTDINALVDESFRLSYHGLRAKDKTFNATMVTHYDPENPKMEIVSQDVGRVVLNLINNAFYAVTEKKKLLSANSLNAEDVKNLVGFQNLRGLDENLRSLKTKYEPTVTVSTQKLDQSVEIRVKDNGTGMPESVKEKVFQPFFTTKPTGQGTGLGLSLSYEIITKGHEGNIEINTKDGEFTEFIIKLPYLYKK